MVRLNSKIDNLGADMQWMKVSLIEWTKAIDHEEQTKALIEKYCIGDEKKAEVRRSRFSMFRFFKKIIMNRPDSMHLQALEVRRQALQKTNIKNSERLIELENEKQSLEKVIERTTTLFHQTENERRQITKTWTAAVQSLNTRNNSIRDVMEVSITILI